MKKLPKKVLAGLLCVTMATGAEAGLLGGTALRVSASDVTVESQTAAYSKNEPIIAGQLIASKNASLSDISDHSGEVVNLSESGSNGFCPKSDCWVRYDFEAEKAGTYTFVVKYKARTGNMRKLDYAIDSTDQANRVTLDLAQSDDMRYAVIERELEAGTHGFYFFCPTGFDDTAIKSCDVYGWSVYLTKETEIDVTEYIPVLNGAPRYCNGHIDSAFLKAEADAAEGYNDREPLVTVADDDVRANSYLLWDEYGLYTCTTIDYLSEITFAEGDYTHFSVKVNGVEYALDLRPGDNNRGWENFTSEKNELLNGDDIHFESSQHIGFGNRYGAGFVLPFTTLGAGDKLSWSATVHYGESTLEIPETDMILSDAKAYTGFSNFHPAVNKNQRYVISSSDEANSVDGVISEDEYCQLPFDSDNYSIIDNSGSSIEVTEDMMKLYFDYDDAEKAVYVGIRVKDFELLKENTEQSYSLQIATNRGDWFVTNWENRAGADGIECVSLHDDTANETVYEYKLPYDKLHWTEMNTSDAAADSDLQRRLK